MEKVSVDKQFTLKVKDALKGAYMAVVVPILVTILEVVQAGSFDLDWDSLLKIAISSLAAYLLKNYLQPTKIVIEKPEPETVVTAKGGKGSGQILHPPSNPIHPVK